MKNLCSLATLLLLAASPAMAIRFERVETFVQPEGEVLAEEMWLVAESAQLSGVAHDDLFILGVSNVLSGNVEKDIWVAGDAVSVEGSVGDDARLAGRSVSLNGPVVGDLMALGQSVQLATNAHVGGEALIRAEEAVLLGHHDGNVTVSAQRVTLGGNLLGDVHVSAADIVVLKNARIQGDLTYVSGKELFLDDSVELGGDLRREKHLAPTIPFNQILAIQSVFFFGALTVALPFLAIFPRFTGRAVRAVRQATWKCAVVGLVAFCFLPLLTVFAAFTLVAFPLALVTGCAFTVLLFLSKIVVGLALGGALLRRRGHQPFHQVLLALVIGLFLLYVLAMLPHMGMVIWLAVVLCGMGSLIVAILVPETRRPVAE